MVPEEQSGPAAKSDSPVGKGPRRRSRRGGRRHSSRRATNSPEASPAQFPEMAAEKSEESIGSPAQSPEVGKDAVEPAAEPVEQKFIAVRPTPAFRAREHQRQRESLNREPQKESLPETASQPKVRCISKAIEQVNEIIAELKHALEEMDDVLETLELAERQKIDDERDIEDLQRSLRRLNRSRDDDQRNP